VSDAGGTRRQFLASLGYACGLVAAGGCGEAPAPATASRASRLGTTGAILTARFPSLAGKLARVPLVALPTPVQRFEALEKELGLPPLWIKRDDLASPVYGGNKVRKLEYLLGDAAATGASHIVTMGGIGSHHCCATAIFASEIGVSCSLVQTPQPVTEEVLRTLRWSAAYATELHLADGRLDQALSVYRLLARIREGNGVPYFIWAGGSTAIGTVGIVEAGLEFAGQVAAGDLPRPAALLVACGSGGTHAGLLAAMKLAELEIPVIGVRVLTGLLANEVVVHYLANATLDLLRSLSPEVPDVQVTFSDIVIDPGYLGDGYGYPTESGRRAVERLQAEGIQLENTYTGKTMAALFERGLKHGEPLLFWNTYNSREAARPLVDVRALPVDYAKFWAGAP
jgi:D-cysteine desulfhydrase